MSDPLEQTVPIANLDDLVTQLADALVAARDHLNYCGYGDNWERECAREEKLEEKIEAAIKAAGRE